MKKGRGIHKTLKNRRRQRRHNITQRSTSITPEIKPSSSQSLDVTPQDDFYTWANNEWIKNIKKELSPEQVYISQYDNFKLLQHDVYKKTLALVTNYISREKNDVATNMRNLYKSLQSLDTGCVTRHISEYISTYDKMIDEGRLWKFLGYINQNELISWACPIVWELFPDEVNSKVYTSHVRYPVLSLYDYRVYSNDDITKSLKDEIRLSGGRMNMNSSESISAALNVRDFNFNTYKRALVKEYLLYIDEIFATCLGRDYEETHGIHATDVFDIECDILSAMVNYDDTYDTYYRGKRVQSRRRSAITGPRSGTYSHTSIHKKTRGFTHVFTSESEEITGVNWREFAQCIGYTEDNTPRWFVAPQVGYLQKMTHQLKREWTTLKWKSYWYFIFLRQIICFHDKWRSIYSNFNDKVVRGRVESFPQELFPIVGLSYAYSKILSQEYDRMYNNPEMIERLQQMSTMVREAFIERLKKNKWMSPKTKEGTLKKIRAVKVVIGESPYEVADPHLQYDKKDAWGNMCKVSRWRTATLMAGKIDGRCKDELQRIDWSLMKVSGSQSYVVNAFYTASSNSIYIPTCYMNSPLVDDATRGFEYDLAHAGFTFAHEFSHAIHVNGRTYDEKGNVNDWWSPIDIRKYDRFITEVNDQYEAFSKKYGFSIDGTLSLSENLADITGLSICEDCLHKYHNDHNMSDSIRNLSFQYFYTYYAIQNHQVMNKREMLVQVMTNPHLDLKTRTNVPLSRMKEFRRLYNVCKKDGMYWANTGSIW